MTISLARPVDFGIRAELLTGLVRLNLGSTCMSNGGWRDRLILRLFFGGRLAGPRKREKSPAWSELKIRPVAWPDHQQARVRVGKPVRGTRSCEPSATLALGGLLQNLNWVGPRCNATFLSDSRRTTSASL